MSCAQIAPASLPRNVGMPLATLIPAPVSTRSKPCAASMAASSRLLSLSIQVVQNGDSPLNGKSLTLEALPSQCVAHTRGDFGSNQLNALHHRGVRQRAGAVFQVEPGEPQRAGGLDDLAGDGFRGADTERPVGT